MNLGTSLRESKSKCAVKGLQLLDFAGQVAHDLLPTRLPDRIKEPKSAKPRKARDKASGHTLGLGLPNVRQGPYPLPIVREEFP
jgi:hypothetical protein